MRIKTVTLLLVLAFSLAACSTPVYKAASGPYGFGYSDAALEEGRYRITFRARDFNAAYDFALLRAAEITLAKGYDWFRVTNSITNEKADGYSRSRVSVSTGYGSRGYRSSRWGFGMGFPLGGTYDTTVHSIDIQMGKGDRPQSDPDGDRVYDAASVKETIGPRAKPKARDRSTSSDSKVP